MKRLFTFILLAICVLAAHAIKSESVISQLQYGMTLEQVRELCGQEKFSAFHRDTNVREIRCEFLRNEGRGYVNYLMYLQSDSLFRVVKEEREAKTEDVDIVLGGESHVPNSNNTGAIQITNIMPENHAPVTTVNPATQRSTTSLTHFAIQSPEYNLDELKFDYIQYEGNGVVRDIQLNAEDGYIIRTKSGDYYLPHYLNDHYELGGRCFNTGKVMISIGAATEVLGGILYGVGLNKRNPDAVLAGTAFMSIGGACVSVSIPLFCFGDHMRRESNIDFMILNTRR